MKIVNKTEWNTLHIRRLALKVAHVEKLSREQIEGTVIEVAYRRRMLMKFGDRTVDVSRSPLGRGSIGRFHVWLRVPRDTFDPVLWASVIAHEFAHNQGMASHGDMGGRYGSGEEQKYWGWAAAYPVEKTQPKVKRKPDAATVLTKELTKLDASLKNWQRKRKLAETKIKKLTQKRKRIEKRLPSSAAPVPQEP